jgi:hypothetical protein
MAGRINREHPRHWEHIEREAIHRGQQEGKRDQRQRTRQVIVKLAQEVRRGEHADTSPLGLLRELLRRLRR